MIKVNIKINGKKISKEVQDNTLLSDFLRDNLSLTGTHVGCDTSQCGACTIHLNGEETRSCQTTIDFLDDEDEITTIEGLSEDTSHPVQKAWIKHDVSQCGYCQPGQIMTASAFLSRNSNPKDDDIDNAMKMNICRCGAYPRIKKAIQSASEEIRNG
mgnify:CR=1 FL=1